MAAAAPDSAEPPLLVIVPGLKGSHLKKKRSCCGLLPSLCCGRIYVNFWRLITGACCGCGDQMKLPRRYDADGRQLRDDLVPVGIVADVRNPLLHLPNMVDRPHHLIWWARSYLAPPA